MLSLYQQPAIMAKALEEENKNSGSGKNTQLAAPSSPWAEGRHVLPQLPVGFPEGPI